MKFKKVLIFLLLILNIFSVYSVQVIREGSTQSAVSEGIGTFLATLIVFLLIGVAILTITFWIIFKIYTMITSHNQKEKDFLYKEFEMDVNQCFIGRDNTMMKRNWKYFLLFWKRNLVYADTENGLVSVGSYNGETHKKEGYYLICLHDKLGIMKTKKRIIFIPMEIKNKLVKKIVIDNKSVIVLDCEGLDNIGNTDYYYMPLIKEKDNKFTNFSKKIFKEYIEDITLNDIIKKNLLQYRDGVIKSVEVNPNVHLKRRTE